jgi:lipoprotein NlpI
MRYAMSALLAIGIATTAWAQTAEDLLDAAAKALRARQTEDALKLVNRALAKEPDLIAALSVRAAIYDKLKKPAEAADDYRKIIETLANAHQQRGIANFKAGKIKESIDEFDKFIELQPDAKISHWQRGISCYYAGRYDDGRRQFEGYQDFDSNDVENAVWRFMCMARKDGIVKARKEILKIGDDKRVPMRQVYDLYKGDLKPDDVFAAVKAGDPGPNQLSQRLFYAHLYVGIYFELLGNKKAALEHLQKATEDHRIGHYMWDVARIHRDLLARELNAKK